MPGLDFSKIEKGNTQVDVNRTILKYLYQKSQQGLKFANLFDIPCGQGDFLREVKKIFPHCQIMGQDLYETPLPEIKDFFIRADAKDFSHISNQKFDIITSISGVMVFDDITGLFEKAHRHLSDHGYFIITNDNVLTLRDRFSFLFFGRFKRFKLIYSKNEGSWNLVLIQGLWKQFHQNGFEIEKITYTSIRIEDYIFLPLALCLYPVQLLYILLSKGEMTMQERFQLFPFMSLISRHYVIFGRKK